MKEIVLLGDRDPNAVTHRALDAAIAQMPPTIRARWIGTDTPDAAHTSQADALWAVSGTPYRDDSAVYAAISNARISGQPFLGTCGGFQYTVVEFARHVAGLPDAGHAETAAAGERLVVDRLACSLVGEERTVFPVPGTRLSALCGTAPFAGFHWCNYGVAPGYTDLLVQRGLTIGALSTDGGIEAIELPEHPFFVATLFQPQIGSLSGKPLHPLIAAFVATA